MLFLYPDMSFSENDINKFLLEILMTSITPIKKDKRKLT